MDLSPGSVSEPRRLRAGEIMRVVEVVCVAEGIATIVAIVCPSQWRRPAQDRPQDTCKAARDPWDHDFATPPMDESSPAPAPRLAWNECARALSAEKTSTLATTSPHSPRGTESPAASPHRSPPPAMAGTRSTHLLSASHAAAAS